MRNGTHSAEFNEFYRMILIIKYRFKIDGRSPSYWVVIFIEFLIWEEYYL